MYEAKTKPTGASVEAALAAIVPEERRADCRQLDALMRCLTGELPVMWGSAIVGYGCYHYTYASGHSGKSCVTGFAARKADISVYLSACSDRQPELLARLGKHKMGKSCLSLKRLKDVDLAVLEELVRDSVSEVRLRYPDAKG